MRGVWLPAAALVAVLASATGAQAADDGFLLFFNLTPEAITVTVDGEVAGAPQPHQALGRGMTSGEHRLQVALGGGRTVDQRVAFALADLARDSGGVGYWCVAAGQPTASPEPIVMKLPAADCATVARRPRGARP